MKSWEPALPHLATKHTVVTVDLPGHGQAATSTNKNDYTMEATSADLVGLMASLGHSRFDLLGYSMGGRLALFTAVHYPEHIQRLVLESASPGLKTAEERNARVQADNALADRIEQDGIEQFVDFWESISLWDSQQQLSDRSRNRLRQLRLTNHPTGLALSLREMGTGRQPSMWPHLAAFKNPTLLLTGELDMKFCNIAADMMNLLPTAAHQTIQGAGHTIHLEKPAIWVKSVTAFLAAY